MREAKVLKTEPIVKYRVTEERRGSESLVVFEGPAEQLLKARPAGGRRDIFSEKGFKFYQHIGMNQWKEVLDPRPRLKVMQNWRMLK